MMKRIIFIISIMMLGATLSAQDSGSLSKKDQRQLLKEERIKEAAEQAKLMAQYIDSIVGENSFVLEADMLYDRYGQSIPVQSAINFVEVDSLMGVIQVGNPLNIARNGVGGVTYEGSVNGYRKKKNEKRGSYYISYTLTTSFGSFNITMDILPSGRADAKVTGNYSGSLRYSGEVVGLRESKTFKGTSF